MRYWRDCLVCLEQAFKSWCYHSPKLVYLCVGRRRTWQETATASGTDCREREELLWVIGTYFTVCINYLFVVNKMCLLSSKESTLSFAPLCLTFLAARIVELGDARDRRDRGQSRPFHNQLFACQRIIKRLWGITCIWSKYISHPAYLLVPSIQPHASNLGIFSKCPLMGCSVFCFTGF